MDRASFDRIVRRTTPPASRRGAMATLLGGALMFREVAPLAAQPGGNGKSQGNHTGNGKSQGKHNGNGPPPKTSYLGRCHQEFGSSGYRCVCLSPCDLKPFVTVGDGNEKSGICMPDHGRCECLGQQLC